MSVVNLTENVSIISDWMTYLRDVNFQKDSSRFRKNIERIGELLAYEISKKVRYIDTFTQTPVTSTNTKLLYKQPVVICILRAGIPLYNGVINIFDGADSGFIGSYRKEGDEIGIVQSYVSRPVISNRPLIITDTMLATGSSIIQALKELLEKETPSEIHIACIIAAPEGITNIQKEFPNVNIWAASIDEGLNDKNYIVPGLGDAGDLSFGSKVH